MWGQGLALYKHNYKNKKIFSHLDPNPHPHSERGSGSSNSVKCGSGSATLLTICFVYSHFRLNHGVSVSYALESVTSPFSFFFHLFLLLCVYFPALLLPFLCVLFLSFPPLFVPPTVFIHSISATSVEVNICCFCLGSDFIKRYKLLQVFLL
jgi:hypothetical protein